MRAIQDFLAIPVPVYMALPMFLGFLTGLFSETLAGKFFGAAFIANLALEALLWPDAMRGSALSPAFADQFGFTMLISLVAVVIGRGGMITLKVFLPRKPVH